MKNPMEKNGIDPHSPSRNDAAGEHRQLRTHVGAPVPNNQDSMTAGPRGPVLMQDYQQLWFHQDWCNPVE